MRPPSANLTPVSMNAAQSSSEPLEPASLPCAIEALRESIRHQHPEWVDPMGECSPCLEFEQSLSGLIYADPAEREA